MLEFLSLFCLIGFITAEKNRTTTRKSLVPSTVQPTASLIFSSTEKDVWNDYNISYYCIILEATVRQLNTSDYVHLYGTYNGLNHHRILNRRPFDSSKYFDADLPDYKEFSRQLQEYVYGHRRANISALFPPNCGNNTIAWHVYNVTKAELWILVSDRRLNHSEKYVDSEMERLQLQYDLDSSTAVPHIESDSTHIESDSKHIVIFTLEVTAVYLGLMLLLSVSLWTAFAVHKHNRTVENAEAVQLERCYANLAKDSEERATVLEFITKEVNAAKTSTSRPASPTKPTVSSVDESNERITPTGTKRLI